MFKRRNGREDKDTKGLNGRKRCYEETMRSPTAFKSTFSTGKGIKFTRNMPRKYRRGVKVQFYSFFNLGARWCWVVNATRYGRFTPGNDPVPIVQEAGWAPQDRSGRVQEISL